MSFVRALYSKRGTGTTHRQSEKKMGHNTPRFVSLSLFVLPHANRLGIGIAFATAWLLFVSISRRFSCLLLLLLYSVHLLLLKYDGRWTLLAILFISSSISLHSIYYPARCRATCLFLYVFLSNACNYIIRNNSKDFYLTSF